MKKKDERKKNCQKPKQLNVFLSFAAFSKKKNLFVLIRFNKPNFLFHCVLFPGKAFVLRWFYVSFSFCFFFALFITTSTCFSLSLSLSLCLSLYNQLLARWCGTRSVISITIACCLASVSFACLRLPAIARSLCICLPACPPDCACVAIRVCLHCILVSFPATFFCFNSTHTQTHLIRIEQLRCETNWIPYEILPTISLDNFHTC